MTERILSNIGEEDDCQIVLKPDGYFRQGALEGYSRPEREACYIGEAVRREKKKAKQENGERSATYRKLSRELRQINKQLKIRGWED